MNYTSPLILSVFIHLGIGLSFSNFFNIDFDIFNIESAKPISAYVIFEKETEPKKEKIRIPKKTKSLALKSGFFFPTQEMPKIEEVEIERNIDLPYLSKEKVIGCFNILSNNKKAFGLLLDDI